MNALTGSIVFSLLACVGSVLAAGIILAFPEHLARRVVPHVVSYAIGTLLGAALLHMIPHALEELDTARVMMTLLGGLIGFFVFETLVLWRHCHEHECPIHGASAILILVGDFCHNLVDGLVIASSFLASVPLGVTASLAVIAHEIPQEAGDFAILLQDGYSPRKAFFLNALSGCATLIGALLGYAGMHAFSAAMPYALSLAASSFLYIALADLIPARRRKNSPAALLSELVLISLGIMSVAWARHT